MKLGLDPNDAADNLITAQGVAAETTRLRRTYARLFLSFDDKIIASEMLWFLRYAPMYATHNYEFKRSKPFTIMRNVSRKNVVAFRDYEEFMALAEKNEELRFILKYTNLTKDSFEMAKRNPYFNFPFSADVGRYMADNNIIYINNGMNHQFGEEDKERYGDTKKLD